jgi:hypothetical protein
MTRLPNPLCARQWRERLDRFGQSELTVAEFCELEGYSTGAFYQWRRKLRTDELPDAPTFVPVDLGSSHLACGVHRQVEIELPGGAVVKMPSGATADEQRQLISAIVQATSAEVQS